MSNAHKPFYGREILRDQEEAKINEVLQKYKGEKADRTLQEKIYNELSRLKAEGVILIPFKVVLREGREPLFPSVVEVILDTKV